METWVDRNIREAKERRERGESPWHNQPERLNPETPIPEWGINASLNFDEWRRRCDSLNSMET